MERIDQYHFYMNYKNSQTLSDQFKLSWIDYLILILDTQFRKQCLRNSN